MFFEIDLLDFSSRLLHLREFWLLIHPQAAEVAQAVSRVSNPLLASKAARFAKVGTFKWM